MTPTEDSHLHLAPWFAIGLALLLLLYVLAPILAPFVLAGILAYIGNPLVERLSRHRLPRVLAVLVVLGGLVVLSAGLVLIVLPLLMDELGRLGARAPQAMQQANEQFLPWIEQRFGIHLRLDASLVDKLLAASSWDTLKPAFNQLYNSARIGGAAVLGFVVNLLLAPVVTFYLLLEWRNILTYIEKVIPRAWHGRCVAMARDIDAVLAQYLRGQILVMAILALYYSIALWIAGIPSALPVGLVSGLLIFIPYLGFATGFILALMVAALQFAGWPPIVAVLVIYGIGQMLEGFLLTPYLVGERIGLHPLAVIFALLAFGQLFGFFGVLLALPASAMLSVGLRDLRAAYLASRFYQGQQ
jgi:predicted PurR-regulated permease PerM